MTALGDREVKRTFSAQVANFTGLPRRDTREAGRQDFGELGDAFVCGSRVIACNGHHSKLTQIY
jgi:hypothetical protein